MTHKEYNGWTNHETWVVNLWMDNDEGSQEYWRERAEEAWSDSDGDRDDASAALADNIQQEHEEQQPEVTGVYADLLSAALSEVNWHEIADALIDNVIEAENDRLKHVEIFEMTAEDFLDASPDTWMAVRMDDAKSCENITAEERHLNAESLAGWYWWTCLPGCLPDSDAFGPFDTQTAARCDALDNN